MANQKSLIERRSRRVQYTELLEIGSKIEATITNECAVQTLKKITAVAEHSDKILEQGSHEDRLESTTEVVMDAQCIKMTHELVGSIVDIMGNTEISDDEYIMALNRKIGPNNDWDKFAEISARMSRTITYSQPLFGTFVEGTVMPSKEPKERRKNTKAKDTQEVRLKSIVQSKKDEEEAKTVNAVGTQIVTLFERNGNQPLPYYELIIDPGNFMRTIQNAFQVSFLFRDGFVAIEQDEYGYPTVRPTNETDTNGTHHKNNHQMISNISTKLCDEMIRRYDITEPMMKLRFHNED